MDNALAAMLAKANADTEQGKPTLLLDAAFIVINNNQLSHSEKSEQIAALEQQAKGQERAHFAEVWESLYVSTPFEQHYTATSEPK
ncbi:hypothetical protein [Shewanella glacialimarina]|uniref:hypothetical protein n=1 Tax=Shewanella glacialimarina TaxID=2590884 RepID=UPI001CF81BE5|nr:hypothetical protein [Shewanella glacialimarina]UCX05433.1 hypothetical protein FJ709_13625 [Shewanella glacialimarina]